MNENKKCRWSDRVPTRTHFFTTTLCHQQGIISSVAADSLAKGPKSSAASSPANPSSPSKVVDNLPDFDSPDVNRDGGTDMGDTSHNGVQWHGCTVTANRLRSLVYDSDVDTDTVKATSCSI